MSYERIMALLKNGWREMNLTDYVREYCDQLGRAMWNGTVGDFSLTYWLDRDRKIAVCRARFWEG